MKSSRHARSIDHVLLLDTLVKELEEIVFFKLFTTLLRMIEYGWRGCKLLIGVKNQPVIFSEFTETTFESLAISRRKALWRLTARLPAKSE